MNIKRISTSAIISLSLIFSNLSCINATNNLGTTTDEKNNTKNIHTYSTSNYKKIELNKNYKHEIRYEPYDTSYNPNLFIEFEIKQDGYIIFNKGGLYTNEGELKQDNYTLGFTLYGNVYNNNEPSEIRNFNYMNTKTYKISLY